MNLWKFPLIAAVLVLGFFVFFSSPDFLLPVWNAVLDASGKASVAVEKVFEAVVSALH